MSASLIGAVQRPNGKGPSAYTERILRQAINGKWTGQRVIEELYEELNSALPPIISAHDLCANPPPTPPEVIEGILHQGSKLMLGGGSKSFKTWTLLMLAICVALGREWLRFRTTKGGVLYLNFELPGFSIEKRIREICAEMGGEEAPRNLDVWNLRGYATEATNILPRITPAAKRGNYRLIILDPFYKILGEREENQTHGIATLMNAIERVAVDTGAAIAFGSHFAKGNASLKESIDRVSGSGVFARDPDSIITMTAHKQEHAFTVDMTLRNFPPQLPFVVRRQHPLMVIDGKLDPKDLKQPAGRKREHQPEDLLKALDGSMTDKTWKAAAAERGISKSTYYELKNRLERSGRVFLSELDNKWSLRP